jgi:hypothetical protein
MNEIESGEEICAIIIEIFNDKQQYQPTDSEETIDTLRHARHVRFSQRAKLAAKLVQNKQLPIYHRGLAARLLACTLARAPGPAIAEQIQNTLPVVSAILDTMNKASSGKSYANAPPLTPVDGHRIGINCAAALAQIHDPTAASSRHTLDVEQANMVMMPYPERYIDPVLDNYNNNNNDNNNNNNSYYESGPESRTGTGFWTGLDRTETRGTLNTQSSGYLSINNPSRLNTAMTQMTHMTQNSTITSEGAYDYQRGMPPEHRPSTQFSNMAGDMGLYDDDIKRQMHVLRMQQQQELGYDQEESASGKMFDALNNAVTQLGPEERQGHERQGHERDGTQEQNSRFRSGSPEQHHVQRRLKEPTATYEEFIRVMLATPAQGAPSRSFNKPTNPKLAELSHTVRQNWSAMPHYLEAMGLLENYPMHAYQQSQKVQRAYERTKMRELYAIDLHNTLSEANTGKLNTKKRKKRKSEKTKGAKGACIANGNQLVDFYFYSFSLLQTCFIVIVLFSSYSQTTQTCLF